MKLLDLFAGRWGWGRAFAERGWEVVGVDLTVPPEIPAGCYFIQADVLHLKFLPDVGFFMAIDGIPYKFLGHFDFICASSPCEQFSVHGMKHFHPNPRYPSLGIELFNHTREISEASGIPYVMENVRPAQKFVGTAATHCGPFYLWGNGVPPLMPQGITKGMKMGGGHDFTKMTQEEKRAIRLSDGFMRSSSKSKERKRLTALVATIPPELATAVCDYAERILEQRSAA